MTCGFQGCGLPLRAKGLCQSHWRQQHVGKELQALSPPAARRRRGIGLICSVPGCTREYRDRGLCGAHYQQARRGKPFKEPRQVGVHDRCTVAGCERPHKANGLCSGHNVRRSLGQELTPLQQYPGVVAAFWQKVNKESGPVHPTLGRCWVWIGSTVGNRYGQAWTAGGHVLAHRKSWELSNGTIPPGLEVCHSCDNPPCVNPAHLFLGDHTDNMRDASAKGRLSSGEACPRAILTDAIVIEARKRFSAGESSLALAKEFGIDASALYRAIVALGWKHIPNPAPRRGIDMTKRRQQRAT